MSISIYFVNYPIKNKSSIFFEFYYLIILPYSHLSLNSLSQTIFSRRSSVFMRLQHHNSCIYNLNLMALKKCKIYLDRRFWEFGSCKLRNFRIPNLGEIFLLRISNFKYRKQSGGFQSKWDWNFRNKVTYFVAPASLRLVRLFL